MFNFDFFRPTNCTMKLFCTFYWFHTQSHIIFEALKIFLRLHCRCNKLFLQNALYKCEYKFCKLSWLQICSRDKKTLVLKSRTSSAELDYPNGCIHFCSLGRRIRLPLYFLVVPGGIFFFCPSFFLFWM